MKRNIFVRLELECMDNVEGVHFTGLPQVCRLYFSRTGMAL